MCGTLRSALTRFGLTAALALTMLAAVSFVTQAAPASARSPVAQQQETFRRGGGLAAALIRSTSDLTRLTSEQVLNELRAGKSLAEIAAANGSSGDAVVQVVVAKVKERLERLVAAGRLTQAQADQRLATVTTQATELVNDITLGQKIDTRIENRQQHAVMMALVQAASDTTGLSAHEIVTRLRNGESLEQIVRSAGSDPAAVINDATAAFRAAAESAMTATRQAP
ncbi:MAG: hypothetical protein ACUVS4_00960 [Chloroflexaceae bacterium]